MSWIVGSRVGFSTSYAVSPLFLVAAGVGLALVAVWLGQTARDSLLPTILLFASTATASYVASRWFPGSATIWAWSCIVLGGVAVVAGRMWRRGELPDEQLLPADAATGAAQHHEVVVKDLGMPDDWPA